MQRISLACNRRTVAYTETDGEKIQMAMKQWPEIVKAGIGHAKSIARVGDSRLATLLEDPDFNRLLKIQNEMPKAITWMVSSQWKVAWLWKLLTLPSGGVGSMFSCMACSLLMPYVLPIAHCSDGAAHVSVPQASYFI